MKWSTPAAVLALGVCLKGELTSPILHHLSFDHPPAGGTRGSTSVTPSAGHRPLAFGLRGTGVTWSAGGGGVRPHGGHLLLTGDSGRVQLGSRTDLNLGPDGGVAMWVRARLERAPSTLFHAGVPGYTRCGWEAAMRAESEAPSFARSEPVSMRGCREACDADRRCGGVQFSPRAADPSVGVCELLDLSASRNGTSFNATTHTSTLFSRCSDAGGHLSLRILSSGGVELTRGQGVCSTEPGILSDDTWTLLAAVWSLSETGSWEGGNLAGDGRVSIYRLAPEATRLADCTGTEWTSKRLGHLAALGAILSAGADPSTSVYSLHGAIDDLSILRVGARDVGAIMNVGLKLSTIAEESFDRGGETGLKGRALRPASGGTHLTVESWAGLGALSEISVCGWVLPECDGDACGRAFSVESARDGTSRLHLNLLSGGQASFVVGDGAVNGAAPRWVGCFVPRGHPDPGWPGFTTKMTAFECAVKCGPNAYAGLQRDATGYSSLKYFCTCISGDPDRLLERAPDEDCSGACAGEDASIVPQHCGRPDRFAVYKQFALGGYMLSPGAQCGGGYGMVHSALECSRAAVQLNLPNSSTIDASTPVDSPPGCWWDVSAQELVWNPVTIPDHLRLVRRVETAQGVRAVCRVPESDDRLWTPRRWSWVCAGFNTTGTYLSTGGVRSWGGSPPSSKTFAFREGDVFLLGGHGFSGLVDEVRISRGWTGVAIGDLGGIGHHRWRLSDLNRLHSGELLRGVGYDASGLVPHGNTSAAGGWG
eukprot:Hpha_TRINITY_DN13845_c0_g1::TRINITY_DN13845_c0_g1_i1::g.69610::m.69610